MSSTLFRLSLVTLLSASALTTDAQKPQVLPATALHAFGRTLLTDRQIELIGSASHVGFAFTGKSCQVFASTLSDTGYHNYLQYELDGVYQRRVRIKGGDTAALTISAASAGRHTVWIYKATEAHTGPIYIKKIIGKEVQSVGEPEAPLIEFIGNSITCGAAADPSETPCGVGVYHDQHNAYMAYGPRVARALHVNFMVSSVSGIGIYRNWNSDGPTMPQVFDRADFQLDGNRPWDFSRYHPRIVSIALGTNDYSKGDGIKFRLPFDSAVFVDRYIDFVRLVKGKYPEAQIALLSSPMINGERREQFQRCLQAIKNRIDAAYPGDKPVALYFFKPMQARGCSGHPNVEDHAILAEELTPFFRGLLQ